jgi:hypothetical protein
MAKTTIQIICLSFTRNRLLLFCVVSRQGASVFEQGAHQPARTLDRERLLADAGLPAELDHFQTFSALLQNPGLTLPSEEPRWNRLVLEKGSHARRLVSTSDQTTKFESGGKMSAKSTAVSLANCLFLTALFVVGPAWTQTASTGALTVTAANPTGAVVPGARITVTSTATGTPRTHAAESNGSYTFTLLPPGTCKVAISAASL